MLIVIFAAQSPLLQHHIGKVRLVIFMAPFYYTLLLRIVAYQTEMVLHGSQLKALLTEHPVGKLYLLRLMI